MKSAGARLVAVVALAIALIESNDVVAQSIDRADLALIEAIRAGNEKAARELLDTGADPDTSIGTSEDDSALCLATTPGRFGLLNLLLDHGASVDTLYLDGGIFYGSPLACAISHGNREAFDVLIEAGADPTLKLCPECEGDLDTSPFEVAIDSGEYDMMWRLVELDAVGRKEVEELVFALENFPPIEKGEKNDPFRIKLIEWIREQGIEVTPKTGYTPRPRPR